MKKFVTLFLGLMMASAMYLMAQEKEEISITVGTGTDISYSVPFGLSSSYSLSQVLYYPEELNYMTGNITGIMLETTPFETSLENVPVKVWIGETDWDNLFFQWVEPSELTLVFDATLDFAASGTGENVMIDFDVPYNYQGGNLALYYYKGHGQLHESAYFYGVYEMGVIKVNYMASDSPLDPMNPDGGSPGMTRPNTTFYMNVNTGDSYVVTFNIVDKEGSSVDDAIITFDGNELAAGEYIINDVAIGGYNYSVKKDGYVTASGTAAVINQNVEISVVLQEALNISGYIYEDFNHVANDLRPSGWGGDFYVMEDGGLDNSKRFTRDFWFLDGPRTLKTNNVIMGSDPVFQFYYRIMEKNTYPNNTVSGDAFEMSISISKDFGYTWDVIYNVAQGEHTPSREYQLMDLDVSAYANETCIIEILVNRFFNVNEDFYFDIDNFTLGTQLNNDLAVAGKIEGSYAPAINKENVYTITVKNLGVATQNNYTVRLMKEDGVELASVAGQAIASKESQRYELTWTPTEIEKTSFYGEIVFAGDEQNVNNKTNDFIVTVQPEGITAVSILEGEGEDGAVIPYTFSFQYSLSQTLYYAEEMNIPKGSYITGILYKSRFTTPAKGINVTVWVGETDSTNLYNNWIQPSTLQKIFEGGIDISDIDGDNVYLEFDPPYQYNGRNILIYSYKDHPETIYENQFYGKNKLGFVHSIYDFDDNPFNVNNPSGGSPYLTKPSTTILYRGGDNGNYSVTFEITDQEGSTINDAVVTFDGTALPAGQYQISDVASGNYPYNVSKAGYDAVSGSVTVINADVKEEVVLGPVGIESAAISPLSIYPNPTIGRIRVASPQTSINNIKVFDMAGRFVFEMENINATETNIDLTNLADGLYFIKIDSQLIKIVKQ